MPSLSPEARDYLLSFERRYPGLLDTTEGRQILTRLNPRLFALVFLRHHLAGDETGDVISFSEAHLDWYDQMLEWIKPNKDPKAWRRAYVSPRNSAKSTVWFLIAILWAAAHRHVRFAAAFADSATQAEGHLATFKRELDTNELLRKDFPKLCRPLLRNNKAISVSDSRSMTQQGNGFIFAAKGVDSATLGMKVGERRPDLIILDDVEPDGSNYSPGQAEKRLATVQNAILPLNEWARVVLVGTVTMDGSLVHQLVTSVTTTEPPASWILDEKFQTHYYPALIEGDDGRQRSLWPEKWPLEYLQSMQHTRSFALNYMNQPIPADGTYWSAEDILVEDIPDGLPTRTILSVDPAVTTKTTSDYTGLAVLSYSPRKRDRNGNVTGTGKVYVRDVRRVKLDSKSLRVLVGELLELFPEIAAIFCEINQGGDLWADVFGDLPVKYVTKQQSVKKETRIGWLHNGYQRRRVVHTVTLPSFNRTLLAYPMVTNDDDIDAVGSGFCWFNGIGSEKEAAGVLSGRTV